MLLPATLPLITEILRTALARRPALLRPAADNLIQALFRRHMRQLKSQRDLLTDFLWLLDIMVDLGVSVTYQIREDVTRRCNYFQNPLRFEIESWLTKRIQLEIGGIGFNHG